MQCEFESHRGHQSWGTIIAIDTTSTRPRLALILLSAILFGVLVFLATQINSWWMTGSDTWVFNWFDEHRPHPSPGKSNKIFAFIGQPVHVAIAGLASGTVLALQARSVLRLIVVTGAVGAGAALEQTFKAIVERTPEHVALLDGYASTFPSGHVTGAATLFGMIAVCLGTRRSREVKATLAAVATAGVVSVGVLALYVRAHTFTDVIGGMVLGGALVALGAAAIVTHQTRASAR